MMHEKFRIHFEEARIQMRELHPSFEPLSGGADNAKCVSGVIIIANSATNYLCALKVRFDIACAHPQNALDSGGAGASERGISFR